MTEKIKAEITQEEGVWINVMRINAATRRKEIILKWRLWRFEFTFNWRSKSNLMGRFGGGWNWQFGFEAGGGTIIFCFLVCSLRIEFQKRKPQ